MNIRIFDFEGPFTKSESVGYAEINFLKQTQEDLADLWVTLEGKNARAAGCKIHLRVILVNTIESNNVGLHPESRERSWKKGMHAFTHMCTCIYVYNCFG